MEQIMCGMLAPQRPDMMRKLCIWSAGQKEILFTSVMGD